MRPLGLKRLRRPGKFDGLFTLYFDCYHFDIQAAGNRMNRRPCGWNEARLKRGRLSQFQEWGRGAFIRSLLVIVFKQRWASISQPPTPRSTRRWETTSSSGTSPPRCKVSLFAYSGWRNKMEDAIITKLNLQPGMSIFGVFDGHGGTYHSMQVPKSQSSSRSTSSLNS